ncbi:NADH-FMN oxidoreductase RutF, flavin reductase (DIM6/NTAB) family [Frankia canadensis]|uniref:NADH-FMN oxidoreductase RutF, flavin reductase (DIM6/NTAB) family n=1 Tax=Frankia canadensis TaxID=1836972 RepID=A0A2I2KPV0_9ACTN|nr:flavin reductase family protein [Frankia canadensis]SNQ47679.1 NADH-FMN oxidoreductase RutF, flavin reductase (DIM6/NTAB) family [Frankia canadensis]SOU54969.1 NADH-FMN oxidoreductase RutF, flavin reductase (DIM6/NTAB) family [Frankia canadensis]
MTTDSRPYVDEACFRDVVSRFASGIVVVTAQVDGRPVGLTCQSFTSLSLVPPMVLFCPSKTSTSWPMVAAAEAICINILSEGQDQVSNGFARSGANKFAGVDWSLLANGAPALHEAAAHLGARVAETYDGGDHHIVTCHVEFLRARDERDPLLYYRSRYRRLHAAE